MEASSPSPALLAVESFSYGWLSNARTSLNASSEAFFRELDLKSQSFDFDLPVSRPPIPFIHADELFSHGLIKPSFANPSKLDCSSSNSISTMPFSPDNQAYCHFLGRWRKSTGRMLRRCLRNISILYKKARNSKRVDDVGRIRESWEVKRWNNVCYNSPRASPLISATTYARSDWGDNMESSIYEAILYCKKSIEK